MASLLLAGSGFAAATLLPPRTPPADEAVSWWRPPADSLIPAGAAGVSIRYGRELIAHTARYLGPRGTVARLSNGMNCQNCHLDAGTRVWGNNYGGVRATYPRYRDRSGTVETIRRRITDCFERSLAGRAPDSSSREMQAMVAYIDWLGTAVPAGRKPAGAGLTRLPYPDRAADPIRGKAVYRTRCQSCHGAQGAGLRVAGAREYTYPPLWGPASYNDAAGLYRLSNFAGYIKSNMPFGATFDTPQLSDADAWDVAAFVNSMPRPHKDQQRDWPDRRTKPVDFPTGPYSDSFSEQQHKFGPWAPIVAARNAQSTLQK
ncbi:c-type cytochrome [Spirosoma luteolum]